MIAAAIGVACAVALALLGAPWWSAGIAAILAFGSFLRGPSRAVALLAGPLVAVSALPVDSIAGARALAVAGVVALHTAPLWVMIGGRIPWRGLLVVPLLALLLVALWFHPWSVSLFDSDVAARTQIGLMAVTVWVASLVVRRVHSR